MARVHVTRDWLVGLGRAGAVERQALCSGDASRARAWFAMPDMAGLTGGIGLLACADRVYAVGGTATLEAWHTWLRHALIQARVPPAQGLMLGSGLALEAARGLGLAAHDIDDTAAALAWAETRLRQRYGVCPGALGTAWGKAAGSARTAAAA